MQISILLKCTDILLKWFSINLVFSPKYTEQMGCEVPKKQPLGKTAKLCYNQ